MGKVHIIDGVGLEEFMNAPEVEVDLDGPASPFTLACARAHHERLKRLGIPVYFGGKSTVQCEDDRITFTITRGDGSSYERACSWEEGTLVSDIDGNPESEKAVRKFVKWMDNATRLYRSA